MGGAAAGKAAGKFAGKMLKNWSPAAKKLLKAGQKSGKKLDDAAMKSIRRKGAKITKAAKKKKDIYKRPRLRKSTRKKIWDNAQKASKDGRVRDPLTGKLMSRNKAWDAGHRPGYEFRKLKQWAKQNNVTRKEFRDMYNNPDHFRPELPSSNRSHAGEDFTKAFKPEAVKDWADELARIRRGG